MIKTIEEVEQILYTYLSEIFAFENAISNIYKLNDLPFNMLSQFPQKGSIFYNDKKTDYQYHGNGCTLVIGGVEIQYSIYADRKNNIAISPWQLLRFIQTVYSESAENITQKQILKYIEELEKQKVVYRIFETYQVYEINLEWYKNFRPSQ